jgi:hypothetical protein
MWRKDKWHYLALVILVVVVLDGRGLDAITIPSDECLLNMYYSQWTPQKVRAITSDGNVTEGAANPSHSQLSVPPDSNITVEWSPDSSTFYTALTGVICSGGRSAHVHLCCPSCGGCGSCCPPKVCTAGFCAEPRHETSIVATSVTVEPSTLYFTGDIVVGNNDAPQVFTVWVNFTVSGAAANASLLDVYMEFESSPFWEVTSLIYAPGTPDIICNPNGVTSMDCGYVPPVTTLSPGSYYFYAINQLELMCTGDIADDILSADLVHATITYDSKMIAQQNVTVTVNGVTPQCQY